MRPARITAMRSPISRATARSWVTNSTVIPIRARRSRISANTLLASEASSALVGSSHNNTAGGIMVARASATR